MSTSENTTVKPSNPLKLEGNHWNELIAVLDLNTSTALGDWISEDLERLEDQLSHFASPQAIKKSLRR